MGYIRMKLLAVFMFVIFHPLNNKSRIKALVRLLRWQIGARLLSCDVIFPWIYGIKVATRIGETGFTGNIYAGLHEYQEMLFCLHLLKGTELFIDVGANIGSYSLLVSRISGCECLAFEPSEETYLRLNINISLNNLQNKITVYKCAVGEKNSIINFSRGLDTVNHIISENEVIDSHIEVEVRTLDSILDLRRPAVMKIDVEGYESKVLLGAENLLQSDLLNVVIMEINGSESRYGFDECNLMERMLDFGFKPYSYDPFSRDLTLLNSRAQHGNTIFIKNEQIVRQAIEQSNFIFINGIKI
jgi:FkbM family methyltransferase